MMQCESLRIIVLVSEGVHPVSDRPCRAALDAQAVELALQQQGVMLEVVHAGSSASPVLRDYLGMGIGQITVLSLSENTERTSVLAQYVNQAEPDLVLCGEQAESGEASGLLPYQLADQLGWALVPYIAGLTSAGKGQLELLQALPHGQRRKLLVRQPVVVTINSAAPAARQSAFAKARDGTIRIVEPSLVYVEDDELNQWQLLPEKHRPKRLKVITATSAAERMKAATTVAQGQIGRVLQEESPQQAAEAILEVLRREGVLKR